MEKLVWSEMGWWLRSQDLKLLGEAGNPTYRIVDQCQALRIGDEVLVSSSSLHPRMILLSADIKVQGFGPDKDGRILRNLLHENIIYNYSLNPYKE